MTRCVSQRCGVRKIKMRGARKFLYYFCVTTDQQGYTLEGRRSSYELALMGARN